MQGLVLGLSLALQAVRIRQLTLIGAKDDESVVAKVRFLQEGRHPPHLMIEGLAKTVITGQFPHGPPAVLRRDVGPSNDLAGLIAGKGFRRPKRRWGSPQDK